MSKVKTYKPGFLESLHQAETSEKKAQLRLLVALDWLYNWGYASQLNLLSLLSEEGTKAERTSILQAIYRWERKYIKRFTLPAGQSKAGYTLSKEGYYKLKSELPAPLKRVIAGARRPSILARLRHGFAIQAVVIQCLKKGGYSKYASTLECSAAGVKAGAIIEKTHERVAVKVLTPPYPAKGSLCADVRYSQGLALDKNQLIFRVDYFVPTADLRQELSEIIKTEAIAGNVNAVLSKEVAKVTGVKEPGAC